jgi:hypothetical protein
MFYVTAVHVVSTTYSYQFVFEQVGCTNKAPDSEVELQELQEVIRLVQEGPPPPCPLLLYTIMNSDNK